MRLGTYYRSLVLRHIGADISRDSVVDVGCYDGYLLSTLPAVRKVGVDISPARRPYFPVLRGDAGELVRRGVRFQTVLALDVLASAPSERRLLEDLSRLVAPGGAIWLSTPSDRFSIFPARATPLVSWAWRDRRLGYSVQAVEALLPEGFSLRVLPWNEPVFRAAYLPLRLLWATLPPRLARRLVRLVARLDALAREGEEGHLFFRIAALGGGCG